MKIGIDPWLAIRKSGETGKVALAGYESYNRNGLVYFYSEIGGMTWNPYDTLNFGGGMIMQQWP